MLQDPTLWHAISHASFVVKMVITILLIASVISWTIILERYLLFRTIRKDIRQFERRFFSAHDIHTLWQQLQTRNDSTLGALFNIGFTAFQKNNIPAAERSMRLMTGETLDRLERHLTFLATVGSTSPYIGLFGTVWGIMTSLQALGAAQQATISMVAPGISEALIATAIGLFAAIPAVIAYNRFSHELERITDCFDRFQERVLGTFEAQEIIACEQPNAV